jgi:hypothetical protein
MVTPVENAYAGTKTRLFEHVCINTTLKYCFVVSLQLRVFREFPMATKSIKVEPALTKGVNHAPHHQQREISGNLFR